MGWVGLSSTTSRDILGGSPLESLFSTTTDDNGAFAFPVFQAGLMAQACGDRARREPNASQIAHENRRCDRRDDGRHGVRRRLCSERNPS